MQYRTHSITCFNTHTAAISPHICTEKKSRVVHYHSDSSDEKKRTRQNPTNKTAITNRTERQTAEQQHAYRLWCIHIAFRITGIVQFPHRHRCTTHKPTNQQTTQSALWQ